MKKLIWTTRAKLQMSFIFEYNKEQFGLRVATKIVQDINKHVKLLKKQPFLGMLKESANAQEQYRYIIRKRCKIYYTIESDSIRVALVWDTRQNPGQLKSIL